MNQVGRTKANVISTALTLATGTAPEIIVENGRPVVVLSKVHQQYLRNMMHNSINVHNPNPDMEIRYLWESIDGPIYRYAFPWAVGILAAGFVLGKVVKL